METFGEFIKNKRLELEIGLREFSVKIAYDASNWSKIERGISPFPDDENKLKSIADVLNIEWNSEDYSKLKTLAALTRSELPKEIIQNESVREFLPAFFRAAENEELDKEKIQKLINFLKEK